jgi:hypothetical protein
MFRFPSYKGSFVSLVWASAFVMSLSLPTSPAFSEEQNIKNSDSKPPSKTSAQEMIAPTTPQGDPIQYVRLCPEAGFGFFSLGVNNTCIRVGGLVRGEAGYQQPKKNALGISDALGTYARGRIEIDGRTATDYGPFRAFVRYELTGQTGFYRSDVTASHTNLVTSLDKAFIQFLGFTVGRNQSFFDFYADALNFNTGIMYGLGSDYGTASLAAYSAKIGDKVLATLSLEDRQQRSTFASLLDPSAYYRSKGERIPDIIGAVSVQDSWGSGQLSGVLHYLEPITPSGSPRRVATKAGYAVQLGARLNMDIIAGGDVLWLQGAYSSGALNYLGIGGNLVIGSSIAPMTDAIIHNGKMTLTTGSGVVAAYQHQWAPNVRQSLFGNYTVVNYKPNFASLYGVGTTRVGTLGTNLLWSPIADFDVGVEVLYSKFKRGQAAVTSLQEGPSVADRIWGAFRVQKSF